MARAYVKNTPILTWKQSRTWLYHSCSIKSFFLINCKNLTTFFHKHLPQFTHNCLLLWVSVISIFLDEKILRLVTLLPIDTLKSNHCWFLYISSVQTSNSIVNFCMFYYWLSKLTLPIWAFSSSIILCPSFFKTFFSSTFSSFLGTLLCRSKAFSFSDSEILVYKKTRKNPWTSFVI